MLVFISAYMGVTNLWMYYRCHKDHQSKLANIIMSYGGGVSYVETLINGVGDVRRNSAGKARQGAN